MGMNNKAFDGHEGIKKAKRRQKGGRKKAERRHCGPELKKTQKMAI